jgi:hypothetical protein
MSTRFVFLGCAEGGALVRKERVSPVYGAAERLTLRKEFNNPLLMYPECGGGDFSLRPAGAVFPYSLDGSGRLVFSWEDGPAASVLLRLAAAGVTTAYINGARLMSEMRERSEGRVWDLDTDRISEELAEAYFRADYIRVKDRFPSAIADCPGRWLSADPFTAALEADAAGNLILGDLCRGTHRYWNPGGSILDLSVGPDGEIISLLH